MRVIIAGGRDYRVTDADRAMLDHLRERLPITSVVSGRARGADRGGETWAKARGVPVDPHPADWDRYDNAAGPIRNTEMAEVADALIAFPGHTGTADMVRKALRKRLWVIFL